MKWNKAFDIALKKAPIKLDISEPPCKICKYWSPRVVTDRMGEVDSIKCCIAEKMYSDFSCFNPKDDDNK